MLLFLSMDRMKMSGINKPPVAMVMTHTTYLTSISMKSHLIASYNISSWSIFARLCQIHDSCLNDSYQPSPFFSIIPISFSSVSLWHCILRHTNTSTFQGQGTHCLSKTSPSNTWSALVAPQNVSRYVAMWPKSRVVSLIFDGIYTFPRGKMSEASSSWM